MGKIKMWNAKRKEGIEGQMDGGTEEGREIKKYRETIKINNKQRFREFTLKISFF